MPYQQLSEYKQAAQYATINNFKIAYWRHQHQNPDAEVLLFIHGFPSAAWDWHAQWQFFSDQYSMLALDLLGFGLSDKPKPHEYSVLEQADIVDQLCQRLGIEKVKVVAHDYGNSVAQELLSRQQQGKLSFTIERLCWLNGGLFSESHRPILTQKLLHSWLGPLIAKIMSKSTLRKGFNKIFGPNTPPKEHELAVLWALIEYNNGAAVMPKILDYLDERQRYRDRWVEAMQYYADNNEVVLCFINGIHDPISGKHMLDQFRLLLPGVHSLELNVGHYPQLEAADEVNAAIKEFMD